MVLECPSTFSTAGTCEDEVVEAAFDNQMAASGRGTELLSDGLPRRAIGANVISLSLVKK